MLSREQAEQIRTKILEQLSKFPEEQVKSLREQINNATPEQLEKFIASQSSGSEDGESKCLFCEIASGNVETIKVFEDSGLFVMMDINPANLGHIIIIPKQHYQFIFQVPDEVLWDMIRTTKLIIPSLINITKAKGFNILMSQGTAAQQRINHFSINIVPRFEDDKISFEMERKQIAEEQKEVAKKLSEILGKVAEEGSKIVEKKSESKGRPLTNPANDNEEKKEPEKQEKNYSLFPRRMP
jgi:histidine triad (HIT) family protein